MPSSISYYGIPPFSCNRVSVVNADIAHIFSDEPQDGYYYHSSGVDSGFLAQSASDIQASSYVATGAGTNAAYAAPSPSASQQFSGIQGADPAAYAAPSPSQSYSHSPGFLTSLAPGFLVAPSPAPVHQHPSTSKPPHPQTQSTRTRRRTDPTHIPRPRNAFIIFRSEFIRAQKAQAAASVSESGPAGMGVSAFGGPNTNTNISTNHQNQLSKQAGLLWRSMSPPSKEKYQDMAKTEQELHRRVYPDYRYSSNRVSGGKQRTRRSKCIRGEGGSEASNSPESTGCFATPSPASTESFATPSPSQAAATPKMDPSIPYTYTFAHLPSEAEKYMYTYTTQTTPDASTGYSTPANVNDREYFSHLLPPSLQFEDVFAGSGNALDAMFPELRQTFNCDLQQTFDVNTDAGYSSTPTFSVDGYSSMLTSVPTPTLDCAHLDFNFFPEPEFAVNEFNCDLEYLASTFLTYS